jgi:hypothetical protein
MEGSSSITQANLLPLTRVAFSRSTKSTTQQKLASAFRTLQAFHLERLKRGNFILSGDQSSCSTVSSSLLQTEQSKLVQTVAQLLNMVHELLSEHCSLMLPRLMKLETSLSSPTKNQH